MFRDMAIGLGVIAAATVVGKLGGLAWAHVRMRRTVDRIRAIAPGRA
jgi:hypothetical protein